MMTITKRIWAMMMSILVFVTAFNIQVYALQANTQGNEYFKQTSIPTGSTGKNMSLTFTFTADRDYDSAYVGIAFTDDDMNYGDEKYVFPFEISNDTFERKAIGKIKEGQTKSVSISAKVRKDITAGYYGVLVYVADSKEGGSTSVQEYVNAYIKVSTTEDKEEIKSVDFVLGQGQETPRGTYPSVMNFSIHMTNRGKVTAQDVVVSMVMDKGAENFPFEINEVSYNRYFEKIAKDEVVSLDYSFAIRKETYTGYYPIKLKVEYKESADGEVKSKELEFFVDINGKSKEDTKGDFNANDRTKARIIVDSFYTVPEKIIAGEEFELVINMKNASTSIGASNILFTFEPEKIENSAVFSTDSGSSSIALDSLAANATSEVRLKLLSKAGIDQRAYTLTIKEQYDSPEYKNASESVSIDIPIYQIARFNVGSIEVNPNDISVGDDTNIMFAVNNTGKVNLYNVMVKFTGESIKENEVYLGNIKPGTSGNVDAMVTAIAPSTGDGKIKATISYEDENGNVTSEDKEIILNVLEAVSDDIIMDEPIVEETVTKPFYQNIKFIVPVILIAGIVIFVLVKRFKKKSGE